MGFTIKIMGEKKRSQLNKRRRLEGLSLRLLASLTFNSTWFSASQITGTIIIVRLAGTGLAGRRTILASAHFLLHVTANTGSPQRMCPGLGIMSDKNVTFLSPLASHRPVQEKMQQQPVPPGGGDVIGQHVSGRSFPWSPESFKCGLCCTFSTEPWPRLFTRYAQCCDEAGGRSQGLDSNSPFGHHHSTHPEGLRLP